MTMRADKLLDRLHRALSDGTLPAWLAQHARGGDPIPEAWAKCFRVWPMWFLLAEVRHPALRRGKGTLFVGRVRRLREMVPTLTLAEVLRLHAAAKETP